jgi:hypothetical protein
MTALRFLLLVVTTFACAPEPVCRVGQVPHAERLASDPRAGYRIFTHAHNDYEHDRPLLDALDAGFLSVEADIYYGDGALIVSHDGNSSKGTLENLYLAPLEQRIAAFHGSVFGDGVPFRLVLDIKEARDELPAALDALLARYPMVTRFGDDAITAGPVQVVFTGDDAMKRSLVARSPSWGTRDSNDFSPTDPAGDPRWTDYALAWSDYLDWEGEGELPEADQQQLECLVDDAHAARRKLRLFGTPDRESVWAAELAAGVDYINTDDLAGLARFLGAQN